MKKMKQILAILLSVVMIAGLAACGRNKNSSVDKGDGDESGTYNTLVIGTQGLNGVFSPFFYSTSYDNQVNSLIFAPISRLNEEGKLVDEAGHVEMEEVTAEDGSTKYVYTVSIQKGMKFSDGEEVTIDDVLFTYYVYADPTYDGMGTFGTLDIEGMDEYVNSSKYRWKAMTDAGKDNTDYTYWTADQQTQFWSELETAGTAFSQEIVDYYVSKEYVKEGDVAGAAAERGFKLAENATVTDFWNAMYEKHNGNLMSLNSEESAGSNLFDSLDESVSEVIGLTDVDSITGIRKVDEYTCTVTFNSPDIAGDKQIAWLSIMPEHYYGADFTKGDLSGVKAKNTEPMGSGAYIFQSYDNNIVTLKANDDYFKGTPKIPTIKFQVVNEEDKVDLILDGTIDITDPSASLEIMKQLDAATDKASYSLVDNPGYGYIGINAERVPDINVRKGLMHLMNRAPAVASFYGDLGHVIERPMTPTLAEYPDDAAEYYGYDPEKALEYFRQAGYELEDSRLVKDGKQLIITIGIGDSSTHPSTPILTQMASDMSEMGAQLVVKDMETANLSNEVRGGNLDMWVMAWGNATDCDQTQMFGSKGGSNYQRYYSPELDAVLNEIRRTIDFDARCELVEKSLDMIMDAAVYMPVYQRKNMVVYNAATLNLDTLPERTTTYYNYVAEIEKLEMQ